MEAGNLRCGLQPGTAPRSGQTLSLTLCLSNLLRWPMPGGVPQGTPRAQGWDLLQAIAYHPTLSFAVQSLELKWSILQRKKAFASLLCLFKTHPPEYG